MKEAANWAASSATETLLTQLLPMCGTMIFRLHGYGHYGQSNGQSNADSPNVEPHGGSPLDWTATLKHTIADFVPIAARLLNFLHLIPSPIDQNPCAHWRNPMDMMRQG
jgi:hypothetical protein